MLSGYYRVESGERGLCARKLFCGENPIFSYEPVFAEHPEGSIILVSDGPVEGGSLSLLAAGGTAKARVWNILEDYNIDPQYPDQVHEEVSHLLANPGLDDIALVDMTADAFITIDNEDSRDLDQAMFIRRDGDGYSLYYALADAAYYVSPQSALFADALLRGASYYLPELSVPMLPSALSEGLISLNPRVKRRALVFVIKLDTEANVLQRYIQRAKILSRAKLSYNGVQRFHDSPEQSPLKDQDFTETLLLLKEVGDRRIALARQRNVIEYDRISLSVQYSDDQGEKFTISEDHRNAVESWNEQISLLCNHEGANMLIEALGQLNIQAIFRVHLAPEEERLKKFSGMLHRLIAEHRLPKKIWFWRWRNGSYGNKETIAEYLRRLPMQDKTSSLRRAIEHQARMVNNASVFTAEPGPHHSLKLDGYARFSSPMREVAGIFTHKEIIEFCSQDAEAEPTAADMELRDKVIEAANRARGVQKQITKAVYKLAIDDLLNEDLSLADDKRPIRTATVFGIRPTRLYLRMENPSIDVKLYADDLSKIYGGEFQCDRRYTVMYSDQANVRFVIGQSLQLKTESYDEQRGRWLLVPADKSPSKAVL